MDLAQKLINEIDQIKDRLPDQNYKNLCDLLKDLSVDPKLQEDLYYMHIIYYEASSDYTSINLKRRTMIINTPLKYNIPPDYNTYNRHKLLVDSLKLSPEPQFIDEFELHDLVPNLVELGRDTVFEMDYNYRGELCDYCIDNVKNRCIDCLRKHKVYVNMPDIMVYCNKVN